MYVALTKAWRAVFTTQRQKIADKVEHFSGGLAKLAEAEQEVARLTKKANEQRALLTARPRTKAAAFHLAAENALGVPRAAGSAHGEWTSDLMPDDAHTPPPPPSVSEWCVPLAMASPPPNRSAEFCVATSWEPRRDGAGSADSVSDATRLSGLSRPDDSDSVRRTTRDSSLLALF